MKRQAAPGQDLRKIAVYARKSKITESGKSIENQITKCKSCAALKFDADEDDVLTYTDEGLSGYYSDRPQYQQMLNDIQAGKIKAVICYKFDRISRRTLDLLNLVEQLRIKKIAFISCSDDLDTSSRTGKIMMSLLASIAEFERDIIAERIADNMYELAKEGRWLGGTTPTGFYSKKERLVVNGKKTTINHLEPIEEEQAVVREMFRRFFDGRSIQKVVDWAKAQGIPTKNGKRHTRISVKNILENPVYAIADADIWRYFSAFNIPIYAGETDFDGVRGLMVYNKTEQTKELRENSTSIHPEYVKRSERREAADWIISVGQHRGIVSGRDWIRAQSILRENRDRCKRPNEGTESLLSGLIACPLCGKNMYTHREYNRYTEGKPRFLYKCQTHRADRFACTYHDLKGNLLDQFILDAICSMSEEDSPYYHKLLDNAALAREQAGQTECALQRLEKARERMRREIESQTRTLRLASDAIKPMLLQDLERLAAEAEQCEEQRARLLAERSRAQSGLASIENAREIIESFPKLLDTLGYGEKLELVRKVVEKVFVLENEAGGGEVHLFLKGTPVEEYADFFESGPGTQPVCVRGRGSIFNTPGRIGGKAGALIVGKSADRLDKTDGADGDQVILVVGGGVIFLGDVGHQPQIMLDELVAGLRVAGLLSVEAFALLGWGQGLGKRTVSFDMQCEIEQICQRQRDKCGKHDWIASPFYDLSYNYMSPGEGFCLSRIRAGRRNFFGACGGKDYSFKPAVFTPCSKYFCPARNTSSAGASIRMDAASEMPALSTVMLGR